MVGWGGVYAEPRPTDRHRQLLLLDTTSAYSNVTTHNMPGIVRKLLIFAAVDGLVLQPVASPRSQNSQRHTTAPLKISYNPPHLISPTISDESHRSRPGSSSGEVASGAYLEAYGIVGILVYCFFCPFVAYEARRTALTM